MKMPVFAAAVSASLLFILPSSGALKISSTFDTDLDGWTVNNATPVFQATGGNPGGYFFFDNPETTISMISAPSKFLGDIRAFDGGTFSFDGNLIQQLAPDFADYGTVTLSGPGGSVSLDIVPDQPTVGVWETYGVEFTASRWGRTQNDWEAILANVTALSITIEAVFGGEQNGVDNITLQQVPEPGTWALLLGGSGMLLALAAKRGSLRWRT